jgi:modulator of FtsH protease HflK
MPWNDQSGGGAGGGGDKGGPWGSGPRRPWGQPPRPPQGPQGPDLEEIMRQFRERMGGMFSGGGGGVRSRGPGGFGWPLIAGALVFGWLALGVYVVDEGEQAVVTRFGAYSRTTGPGLHMHLPVPVESRQVFNVTGQRTDQIGFTTEDNRVTDNPDESLMITGDRNIVEIHFSVNYTIKDVVAFAYNVRAPVGTSNEPGAVRQIAESAMREVIGQRQLEQVMTTDRVAVAQAVEQLMQQTLDEYGAGVLITQVNLSSAAAPQEVTEAFNDVINAGQDAEAAINNANRETSRIINEAQAYQGRVVREATGEAERFISVHNEYRLAPQVTRDRLYLETMERVYRDSNTMIIDQRGGGVPYLSLDSLARRPTTAPPAAQPGAR